MTISKAERARRKEEKRLERVGRIRPVIDVARNRVKEGRLTSEQLRGLDWNSLLDLYNRGASMGEIDAAIGEQIASHEQGDDDERG